MPQFTRRGARALSILLILAAAIAGAFLLPDVLSFEALKHNHDALARFTARHHVVAALLFIATYIAVVALSLPGATICTLTGGFLFGLFPGALFNVTAATIGAVMIFLAARFGFGASIAARIDRSGGAVAKMRDGLREGEISFLLTMRLIPVFPFFLANLLPALLGVSVRRFAVTTFVGIIPDAVIYTSVGAGLGKVFATGRAPDFGILFRPAILGPLLGVAALSMLPVALRAVRRRRA